LYKLYSQTLVCGTTVRTTRHVQPLRTGARRPSPKCLRNALCVAITDSLFLNNISTTKPRCSTDQLMALSKNGKTTANQRDPSLDYTPSTTRAVTPQNVGVISAAASTWNTIISFPLIRIAQSLPTSRNGYSTFYMLSEGCRLVSQCLCLRNGSKISYSTFWHAYIEY
jgi:hypothetical protein